MLQGNENFSACISVTQDMIMICCSFFCLYCLLKLCEITSHDSAGEAAQCCHMRSFLLSSPLAAVTPQRNERKEKAEDGTLYISLR